MAFTFMYVTRMARLNYQKFRAPIFFVGVGAFYMWQDHLAFQRAAMALT